MHRKVGRAQQWNHVFRQHRSCHAHCFSSKLYFHNVSSGSSRNSVGDFGDLVEDQILFFRELGVKMSQGMGSLGSLGNPQQANIQWVIMLYIIQYHLKCKVGDINKQYTLEWVIQEVWVSKQFCFLTELRKCTSKTILPKSTCLEYISYIVYKQSFFVTPKFLNCPL